MSAIDEIIARSRSPGTFVERRSFTLSKEKAIEKLREFSLRNPNQYILELIQAAVFADATYIAVDITPERLLVAWVGGKPFEANDLESIFDYLFADRAERSTRHLTQLAVGLNAILQRNPKSIRIESGDGSAGQTARMDLNAKGEGQLGIPESGLAGTYILVEYPSSWLPRLTSRSVSPEENLIETKCLYIPVPVLLNGRAPFGYRASREIHLYGIQKKHQHRFDVDGRRGVVGLTSSAQSARREFRMVVGGVWISSMPLEALGTPNLATKTHVLCGVICDDNLRKTADQAAIVEDRRYVEMLHAVQPQATTLLKGLSSKYSPPRLPHLPNTESTSEALPSEPLPDRIPQLANRPEIEIDVLKSLPDGEPVLWVRPEDVLEIEAAVSPRNLGPHVLCLTPGQAATLQAEIPKLGLSHLNNATDADFVRRVLERRQLLRRHTVTFQSNKIQHVTGELIIRHHLAGPPPRWGNTKDGDTAAIIMHRNTVLWCGQLPLGMDNISVVVELRRSTDEPQQLITEIIDTVTANVWKLSQSNDVVGDAMAREDAQDKLVTGILGLNVHPYFVQQGNTPTQLALSLPRQWGDTAAEMLKQALFSTTQGDMTLDGFAALQGTRQTRLLSSPADRRPLESLEQRLGFGHLCVDTDDNAPILVAAYTQKRWILIENPKNISSRHATISIRASFTPNWMPEHSPHPVIVRTNVAGRPIHQLEDALWSKGEDMLLQHLVNLAENDRWHKLAVQSGHSTARCRGIGRLAMLALALKHQPKARVLRTTAGTSISPQAMLETTAIRVVPQFGPSNRDTNTVALTFDEHQLLLAAGAQIRLCFDDPPDVWNSLENSEDGRWLIRRAVSAPGMEGWLGLRHPFDGSSGMLVQGFGTLDVIPQSPTAAPCHGLIRTIGARRGLSAAQQELLALSRQQLYQQLQKDAGKLKDARLQTANQYLSAFVAEQAPTRRQRSQEQQSPHKALQQRLRAALPSPLDQEMYLNIIDDPTPRKSQPFRIENNDIRGDMVLLLNKQHPLTRRALSNIRSTAAEIILLEVTRQIALWCMQRRIPVDLLAMHQVLVAQRITQSSGDVRRAIPQGKSELA